MTTESRSSFEISFSDLWTYGIERAGGAERKSLAALAGAGEHVHGSLEILVQGRPLPALGYFGPDDVCFNEWARELVHFRTALTTSGVSTYVYDEGEQGQPSYHFTKVGHEVLVSVRDGMGGGQADPDWCDVSCQLADMTTAVEDFSQSLRSVVVSAAGERGQEWVADVVGD
ncbi:MAG: hypothetical protein GY701_25780 [Sulfitobacter sp.]|nr:hypothetical protein [Sulfitobacter sp.]